VKMKRFLKMGVCLVSLLLVIGVIGSCVPVSSPTSTSITSSPISSPSSPTTKKLKIAAIYLISAADGGFCETLHRSLQEVAKEKGYTYEYSENVALADAENFIRGYAERGFDVIFAHTTGYKTAIEKVAPDYPNIVFGLFAGKTASKNVFLYDWYGNETSYLLGVLAGLMSKSELIGHIGGMKVPNQLRYLGGFEAGVQSVKPTATVKSAFTGSFSDSAAGKEVATSFINQGMDVLFDTMGLAWIGVKDLAKQKGVYILADYGYKTVNAPDVILAGQLVHFDKLLELVLADWDKHSLKEEYWGSLANGICDIMYSSEADKIIPKEVFDKIDLAKRAIISGEIQVPRLDLEATSP